MAQFNNLNGKSYFSRRFGALETERSGWFTRYKNLSKYINPYRGRFHVSDHRTLSRGQKGEEIINNTASWALRTATAGLHAGVMSPARPWFKLGTNDPGLAESGPVKLWLEQVEVILRAIFNSSNLYSMSPLMLGELLQFGTGYMSHVDDFKDVARFYTHTAGSYMIANDGRLDVNTAVREFEMTTSQLVELYGEENVSERVKRNVQKGDLDVWNPVVNFIEPNPDVNPNKKSNQFMPFRSVYYEPGEVRGDDSDKFLKISGFNEFPGYALRWETTGEDVYGNNCPGMVAIGDTRQVQTEERRKAQGIDKSVNPPLQGPSTLLNVPVSSLPGGLTIFGMEPQGGKIEPIYTVNPDVNALMQDIQGVENRIERAFYVDLFLAITNMEGIQPRNELELAERNGERLLQLGPVLERIHKDFLDPLIDRTFAQALRAEILPPAPPALQGKPLKVDYISALAQAQRAVSTGSIDRLTGYIQGLSAIPGMESVVDKFDGDQAVDIYGDVLGAPVRIIRTDEAVAERRAEQAKQQQAAMQAEIAQQQADVGKTVAEAEGMANAQEPA